METETTTTTPPLLWVSRHRFNAWCDTCSAVTESDDATGWWCLQCGDRRATVH